MRNITFVIGRNPKVKNDEIPIKINDFTKQVAESHCKITCEVVSKKIHKNTFWIENLDPINGTYVSGAKINSKIQLINNPLITLGDNDIRFSLNNSTVIKNTLKNIELQSDNIFVEKTNNILKSKDTSMNQTNRVVNVTLKGGIIGLFADSPQNSLNRRIKKENSNGWKVVQVIPASSGNILLIIFRIFLLIITLFLFTTANGYYIILEKKE